MGPEFDPKFAIPIGEQLARNRPLVQFHCRGGGTAMNQRERMNSAGNDWEPVPWDASDKIADEQLKGYGERATKPICWLPIRDLADHSKLFGLEKRWFVSHDVAYFAEHDGEQLILIQLAWHGFPDPPEWGLASRAIGDETEPWNHWGQFAHLPSSWSVPENQ